MCGMVPTTDDGSVLRFHTEAPELVGCQEGGSAMFLLSKKNEAAGGEDQPTAATSKTTTSMQQASMCLLCPARLGPSRASGAGCPRRVGTLRWPPSLAGSTLS